MKFISFVFCSLLLSGLILFSCSGTDKEKADMENGDVSDNYDTDEEQDDNVADSDQTYSTDRFFPKKDEKKHIGDVYIFQNTVSAGHTHSCSTKNGILYCWGENFYGEVGKGTCGWNENKYFPERVGEREDWSVVASGGAHTCGIADGALYCWGLNNYGQLGNGTLKNSSTVLRIGDRSDWKTVSAGSIHTCGIANGELYCWGRNSYGQLGVGTLEYNAVPVRIGDRSDWETVSTGSIHTCGIAGGELFCWGRNSYGQLGDGSSEDKSAPVIIESSKYWNKVSAGDNHTCAISGKELFCWGRNFNGQLGIGETTTQEEDHDRKIPAKVVKLDDNWKDVSAGYAYTCGVNGSTLYCWGMSGDGRLGLGTGAVSSNEPEEVYMDKKWKFISAGLSMSAHTCGTADGGLYCWGDNYFRQVGDGTEKDQYSPVRIGSRINWESVSSGNRSTCGIAGGRLYCWGDNYYGQIGNGKSGKDVFYDSPELIDSEHEWKMVSVGMNHSCGIMMYNYYEDAYAPHLFCWGNNEFGKIGLEHGGSDDFYEKPQFVTYEVMDWTVVSSGYEHTCGIARKGQLYCWGRNDVCQTAAGYAGTCHESFFGATLGTTRVGTRNDWETVSSGYYHTCGIAEGELFCWGYNRNGETGQGHDNSVVNKPGKVGDRNDWQTVSAGGYFTCGIAGGELFCWGSNRLGKLGNSETCGTLEEWTCENKNLPVKVLSDVTGWEKVSTGRNYACAIAKGDLYCWGQNNYDDNESDDFKENAFSPFPVKIEGIKGWTEISCGEDHSCGMAEDGTYCWGNNRKGQLGIASLNDSDFPELLNY